MVIISEISGRFKLIATLRQNGAECRSKCKFAEDCCAPNNGNSQRNICKAGCQIERFTREKKLIENLVAHQQVFFVDFP